MIIEKLLDVVYSIFSTLLSAITFPTLPDEVYTYLDNAMSYIQGGVGIIANFVPIDYLLILFFFVLNMELAFLAYRLIMWIIRKVPFISIS